MKIPGGTFVLLHVGSFRPEKNHVGLLEIVRHVVKAIDPAVLICVGDGRERARIERAARERGLAAIVRFEGTQLDVKRYMAAADVLVFPSRFEGFGNVLVESQDAELPIVASDIAAHREVVAPPQHRFLFSLPDYRKAAYLISAQWRALQANDNCWVSTSAAWVRDRFAFAHVAAVGGGSTRSVCASLDLFSGAPGSSCSSGSFSPIQRCHDIGLSEATLKTARSVVCRLSRAHIWRRSLALSQS